MVRFRSGSLWTGLAAAGVLAAVAGTVALNGQDRVNERRRIYTAALAANDQQYLEPLPSV